MDERPNGIGQGRTFAGVRYVGSGLTGRMIFGLVFMVLGGLWTLDNLGIIDSDLVLRWWPVALIAFGAAKLMGMGMGQGRGRNNFWGVLLVVAGSWMLAQNFELIHISMWQLWPLVLVFIGVSVLVGAGRFSFGDRFRNPTHEGSFRDEAERLSSFAVWGHVVRKVVSQQFRGGDASAVMGGVDLDLRGAKPVPEGAVLEVLAIWGGVDVFVPPDWRVVNQATVIMGAVEDKSRIPPPDAKDTLIVRGLVMMGGVEIKN